MILMMIEDLSPREEFPQINKGHLMDE